ncbi:MAG: hypothetical protein RL591_1587 [Planctomycetota bacterium]
MEETQGATMFHGHFVGARASRHYPSASQKGSATRNDQRSLLSIAQAPLRSAFDKVIHAKASKSGHASSFTPKRASCEAGCERSYLSRSPLRRRPLPSSTPKRASCEAGCERSDTRAQTRSIVTVKRSDVSCSATSSACSRCVASTRERPFLWASIVQRVAAGKLKRAKRQSDSTTKPISFTSSL